MDDKWRSLITDREMRPWLVLTAVFILAALVFAAMAWFSLVVPSVAFLHHHGG
ncbi:hypothetical protein LVY72_17415 [Arthrobacter sp. I2-34]|uniref:Uncharacterized protein n=1 Tax=Arthrobacter hankyongi TaxID=2904801 RepID=A0ABS9LAK3_9MICC|nr:hypothetical protein [Arthrobacter hankyongi]MCG2623675.1 hypothetical protein [Arthrobacter hankyongi]